MAQLGLLTPLHAPQWQLISNFGVLPHGNPMSVIIGTGFRDPSANFGFLIRGKAMKANLTAKSTIALLLCLAASMFLLSPAVRAQGPQNDATVSSGDVGPTADDAHDPPSRVARISFTDGSVSLQP